MRYDFLILGDSPEKGISSTGAKLRGNGSLDEAVSFVLQWLIVRNIRPGLIVHVRGDRPMRKLQRMVRRLYPGIGDIVYCDKSIFDEPDKT